MNIIALVGALFGSIADGLSAILYHRESGKVRKVTVLALLFCACMLGCLIKSSNSAEFCDCMSSMATSTVSVFQSFKLFN